MKGVFLLINVVNSFMARDIGMNLVKRETAGECC